jgi:hypothetical protein
MRFLLKRKKQLFFFIISFFSLSYSQDPIPQQIASSWQRFSGGLEAKVVYNYNDTMCLLNLNTGQSVKLIRFPQANFSFSSDWGKSSGYRISPDGKRIAAQNGSGVIVCNIDGTNVKVIWSGAPCGDQIALCWDGNNKIVYSSCIANNSAWKISCTEIKDDNSAGTTTILWDRSVDKLPSGITYSGSGFVSVNKSGDFLSFDIMTGTNIPIIVKVSTKEAKAPIGTNDGCQVRMIMDSSGTISFHRDTHLAPATLFNWDKGILPQTVPMPPDSMGGCGNAGFSWAYNTDYMIQTGDNDLRGSPGCISKARIRKTKNFNEMIYIGSKYYWPDLWVSTQQTNINKSSQSNFINKAGDININVLKNKILISKNNTINSTPYLTAINGSIVAKAFLGSNGSYEINLKNINNGIYLLCYKSQNNLKSKILTIKR